MSDDLTLSLRGEPLPHFAAPPRTPAGTSPPRRADSIRRTTSLDVTWPEGFDQPALIQGRARDLRTPLHAAAPSTVIAEDALTARAEGRTILSLESDPQRAGIGGMIGVEAGKHLRLAIDCALPGERAAGSPLYLLLDDLAGTTLVASWGKTQWAGPDHAGPQRAGQPSSYAAMEGICIGFRPGSSALGPGSSELYDPASILPPLTRDDDPQGWHRLPTSTGANMRRARRLDIWRENGLIHVDSTFQDSGALPDGRRRGLHEYRMFATADGSTGALLSLQANPHILPYSECPAATVNLEAMLTANLADMRSLVLSRLRQTAGCTHLNDMLRALADVPILAAALQAS